MLSSMKPYKVSLLAELLSCLLKDQSPFIRNEVLEHFNDFANSCPNNDFIKQLLGAMKTDPSSIKIIRSYSMRDTSLNSSKFSSLEEFIHSTTKDAKIAIQDSVFCEKSSQEKEEKRPRLDLRKIERNLNGISAEDLDEKVDNIVKVVEEILEYKHALSEQSITKLRSVVHPALL